MRAKQRLYLTADKKKIVLGAPKAAYLFKAKGQEISKAEIAKYPDLKKYIGEYRENVSDEEKQLKMKKPGNNKMLKPGKNK